MLSSMIARRWRTLPLLLLAATLLLAGCGAGASASSPSASNSPSPAPENQKYIATAIALKASAGGASAEKVAVPSGPRSTAEIAAAAPASGLLDSKHLAAGKGCESCHGTLPSEGRPAMPNSAKCLSCHGGSWDSLIAKTSPLGSRNPHKAHTGRQDCDRCHRVHQPFEFSCNTCHTFATPERFQTTALAGKAGAGSTSATVQDKTED